jgi:enoyl-[acyl-carrier protein] reductase II
MTMVKTPLCELLGLDYPILQGGMAWIADASLAAAVSNAGGLGVVSAMNASADWVRAEIRKTRERTDRPFGVNIMLMSPFANEVAEVVVQEKVPVVTTGAGNPTRYMAAWRQGGIFVLPVVASTAMARLVARAGASAVIAEGGESGGHIGELSTMALVPQVCDCVDVPVVAAGGIADGRQVAAALMLGASGVQVGTRFLSAFECTAHPNYKNRIFKAKDISTMVTGRRTGHPVRCLRTSFAKRYFELESDSNITVAELEAFGSGALRMAAREGDEKNGCFMAGQVAAMVQKEQPAAEIIGEMFAQAQDALMEEADG